MEIDVSRLVGTENRIVTPQRGRVSIIQIGDRFAEFVRQAFADIESCPLRMHKVGRATRTELAGGTGRPGRVQSDGNHIVNSNSRQIGCDLQTIRDLLETYLRSLFRESRMLTQLLNEKTLFPVNQGIVDGSSAQIDTRHYFHCSVLYT